MLLFPFPFPALQLSPSIAALPSIPLWSRAGGARGAQTRQLQLLLFRFKCLHLFITKTPLRFPGSSTGWARELSEETHGRRLSAKTSPKKHPKTCTRPCPGFGGNRAGAWVGVWVIWDPPAGARQDLSIFLGAFRAGPGWWPRDSLAALTV